MTQTKITFLGHTTILIQAGDIRFVFDPNFSKKILSLKRKDEPAIDVQELHKTNVIVYSNAHHNRLDTSSLRYFKQTAQLVLPMEAGKLIDKIYSFHQNELKDGAELEFEGCHLRAIKGLHRGFRNTGVGYSTSLNYILKTPAGTIFYCSDSKYDGSYFYDIGKDFKIDVAILPIDHVGPDVSAGNRFLSVKQSLQAFQDLGASQMIPNAFGSFGFSGRNAEKVIKTLKKEAEQPDLKDKIKVLSPGESISIGD